MYEVQYDMKMCEDMNTKNQITMRNEIKKITWKREKKTIIGNKKNMLANLDVARDKERY